MILLHLDGSGTIITDRIVRAAFSAYSLMASGLDSCIAMPNTLGSLPPQPGRELNDESPAQRMMLIVAP